MVEITVFKGSESGKIIKSTTHKDLQPHEVLIKVTHSGICGTDEHFRHKDMVLGHEGAGIIQELGSSVKDFKINDSVGWGYVHSTCNHCKQCLTGHETLCPQRQMYGYANPDQGSFASHAIWPASYIFSIPSSIPREFAAPLMCGGATVFSALQSARSTDTVGVIGVGGLGHLAVQFASKMGCRVVVFSGTEGKRKEALGLGAKEFVVTKNVESLKVEQPIDHLLVTASVLPDWKLFLPIMAPGGVIYPMTVSSEDFQIPCMPLLGNELRIQGCLVAARQVHRDMLEFAARHGIRPIIEVREMEVEGIEESMGRLREGEVRYRAVVAAK